MLNTFKQGFRSQIYKLKNLSKFSSNFLNSNNAVYADQMYANWKNDPSSVHSSWDAYFTNLEAGIDPNLAFAAPSNLGVDPSKAPNVVFVGSGGSTGGDEGTNQEKITRMFMKYRDLGHEIAQVNPLSEYAGLTKKGVNFRSQQDDPGYHDFQPSEVNKKFKYFSAVPGINQMKTEWTPTEVDETMRELYSGPISFEYMHIGDKEKKQWIRLQIEKKPQINLSKEEKINLLDRILESETFNNFCDTKFTGAKRFGIDGCDSTISGLEMMVDRAKDNGYTNLVLGMAHRGRLNTLACVFDKPYEQIFGEFKDVKGMKSVEDDFGFSGDVKYHLGATAYRKYNDGNQMHCTLLPNPSHLETVNTVAMGKARSKMDQLGDKAGDKVLTCLIHGDAAIAGQGIVYEGLNMEKLRNYHVGGVIHVVVNNQVGFTTNPMDSRSTHYCTDIAKTLSAFVIHVNAQYPEHVDWAFKLAVDYNHRYKRDVFVDVIGYRKYGHNETDMPKFTQPLMYKQIAQIKPMHKLYCDRLISEGVITQEEIDAKIKGFKDIMQAAFDKAASGTLSLKDWDAG